MTRGGRPAVLFVWVWVAASVAACSTPQTRILRQQPPVDIADSVELTQVPFEPSADTLCGPTSLAMMLAHRGRSAPVPVLESEVYLPEREGSLQIEMIAALRARGLVAYRLRGELGDLLRELDAGNPVLVLQNLGLDWLPRWHYAVAVGYRLDTQTLILRSGTLARRETGFHVFENTWARGDYWAVVASPPGTPPATADWLEWLRAAAELRSVGQKQAAGTALQSAARRWPTRVPVLLSAANEAVEVGRTRSAEVLLREATRLEPANADTWNNLAHVLNLRGCGHAARTAIDCALTIDPQHPLYRRTQREIDDSAGVCEPISCPVR